MKADDFTVVQQYFSAMRRKREGTEELVALFSDDAEYIEPFSKMGQPTSRRGKVDIGEFLRATPDNAPPDMEVRVDRVDRQGTSARAEWTCTSSAFSQPMKGYDVFDIRDGKIARL